MPKKYFLTFFLLFSFWTVAQAQILTEIEATPSVLSEPEARILITEVNFKNSQADWVELYYESPSGRGLNLAGISFADDSKFKTVAGFTAQSGQYLLLTFKNAMADKPPYLYTSRSGLTGTTEQFIVYDKNGKVLDAVCWTSSTPTTDEITDMMELYGLYGWHSADTSGCIKSESVKNNMSIARIGFTDTNSASDWEITENMTPGAANGTGKENESTSSSQNAPNTTETVNETSATAEDAITDTENPFAGIETGTAQADNAIETGTSASVQTPGPITQAAAIKTAAKNAATTSTAAKKTTAKTSTAKKTKSSITKAVYANGDLSEEVKISEILPNPKGDDAENEWIEITNTGEEDVNLGNWSLDKGEGSAKPFIISDQTIIAAGTSLLFGIKESKISLTNKGGTVRLVDFEGTVINEVIYEQAPEDQSYGLIAVTLEDGTQSPEWIWSKDTTPGEPSPPHKEITAIITQEPQFEEKYFFQVKTASNETETVYFTEELIPAPLAKATLLKGTNLKMLLRESDGESFFLVRYEILSPPAEEQNGNLYTTSIIGSLVTAAGSAIYFLRKKIPWPSLRQIPLSKQADK